MHGINILVQSPPLPQFTSATLYVKQILWCYSCEIGINRTEWFGEKQASLHEAPMFVLDFAVFFDPFSVS